MMLTPANYIKRFVRYNKKQHGKNLDSFAVILFDVGKDQAYHLTLNELKELLK